MHKLCLPIDKSPMFLRFAETVLGKITLIFTLFILLHFNTTFHGVRIEIITTTVTFITFFPKYRYWWLFIGMLCAINNHILLSHEPDWILVHANLLYNIQQTGNPVTPTPEMIKYADMFIILFLSEGFIQVIRRKRNWIISRYPVTAWYCLLLGMIITVGTMKLSPVDNLYAWSLVGVMNHYFWFMAYTIQESKLVVERNFVLDYARYLPIWGFTTLPYGKGSLYLTKVEAKTSQELAITQLKGIKLAWWALLLSFVLQAYLKGQSYFHIPVLTTVLSEYDAGQYYPMGKAWIVLICRFFKLMLELTVFGHTVVAICRMCGFNILRNTYKPLEAKTIAEYWNRYNYYFKELLSNFYFFPAYLRFFKNSPRMRIFFATFSAATIGNIMFHFLLITPDIMIYGLSEAVRGSLQYALYALILGLSISFSQIRNLHTNVDNRSLTHKIIASILVLSFYMLLGIFSQEYQRQSILVNFKFFLSLFNIQW